MIVLFYFVYFVFTVIILQSVLRDYAKLNLAKITYGGLVLGLNECPVWLQLPKNYWCSFPKWLKKDDLCTFIKAQSKSLKRCKCLTHFDGMLSHLICPCIYHIALLLEDLAYRNQGKLFKTTPQNCKCVLNGMQKWTLKDSTLTSKETNMSAPWFWIRILSTWAFPWLNLRRSLLQISILQKSGIGFIYTSLKKRILVSIPFPISPSGFLTNISSL